MTKKTAKKTELKKPLPKTHILNSPEYIKKHWGEILKGNVSAEARELIKTQTLSTGITVEVFDALFSKHTSNIILLACLV